MYAIIAVEEFSNMTPLVKIVESAAELAVGLIAVSRKVDEIRGTHIVIIEGQDLRVMYPESK